MRIPYEELKDTIYRAFIAAGVPSDKALICAGVHADSSAEGVESHGLNRVPRFVDYVRKGWVDVKAEPEIVEARGAVERINGHRGVGITNALFAADRAMALAKRHGIGCAALADTTHWMRGGTYAEEIARRGMLGICWTNTEMVMPLWGSDQAGVGNNPFCMGLPMKEGAPLVLDMAMSQYAYGKLGVYELAGRETEFPCGFDREGKATCKPGEVLESRRIMPMGYWKGTGLALALDMAAAMLSGGSCGSAIDAAREGSCGGCSQVFISFDPNLFGDGEALMATLARRAEEVRGAHPTDPSHPVHCPGEGAAACRAESMERGVRVDESVWREVKALAES